MLGEERMFVLGTAAIERYPSFLARAEAFGW